MSDRKNVSETSSDSLLTQTAASLEMPKKEIEKIIRGYEDTIIENLSFTEDDIINGIDKKEVYTGLSAFRSSIDEGTTEIEGVEVHNIGLEVVPATEIFKSINKKSIDKIEASKAASGK